MRPLPHACTPIAPKLATPGYDRVNEELDEAFLFLWDAVKADDPDEASRGVIKVELADASRDGPSGCAFDGMMEVLEYVTGRGTCAWHVFFWFEGNFSSMSDAQRQRTRDYVALNYGRFTDETAVLEIAEWVGRIGDEWALEVIADWIARQSTFERYNAASIGAALRELLDDTYGPRISGEHRKRALELSRMFRASQQEKLE